MSAAHDITPLIEMPEPQQPAMPREVPAAGEVATSKEVALRLEALVSQETAIVADPDLEAALDGIHEAWRPFCRQALGGGCHVPVRVELGGVPAPAEAGFVRHRGLWYGQKADWRRTLPDGRGIHIREFADRYELHWDRVCPLRNPVRHMLYDTPWLCASTALLMVALPTGFGYWRKARTR